MGKASHLPSHQFFEVKRASRTAWMQIDTSLIGGAEMRRSTREYVCEEEQRGFRPT